MKILNTQDYPDIPRRVVLVVENPDDPQWVHVNEATGVASASPSGHTGSTNAPGTVCKECRSNWRIVDFTFTGDELQVVLNKWGNPVHDDQAVISTRPRTWDELYQEIDDRLGEHVIFGAATRQAAPDALPEVEPDFGLVPTGPTTMEDSKAVRRYKVLRLGESVRILIVTGSTRQEFQADRDEKYTAAQAEILAEEVAAETAAAIVG